ncbi:MAG: acetyl-CoA carboxylase biotin carboxyl carrier protein [Arenicella sp.]|jgi:acetyl-CoA carboxylase biotin carboxyl carrier protein
MDIKEIQNLIKFVAKSGVNEVAIEQGEFKITIKAEIAGAGEHVFVQQAPMMAAPQVMPSVVQTPAAVGAAPEAPALDETSNLIEIKSPMIGTFYRRSSPDKDAFVNVGDSVSPGDCICIVEAMKLFNEIESEVSGKIVKVLVDDNSPIEYDQPLFLVDPS